MKIYILALMTVVSSWAHAAQEYSGPSVNIIEKSVGFPDRGFQGAFELPRQNNPAISDVYIITLHTIFLVVPSELITQSKYQTSANFLQALNSKKLSTLDCMYPETAAKFPSFKMLGSQNNKWSIEVCKEIHAY